MAYARVSYIGDASTKIYSVPFPYLSKEHVEIRVAGVLKVVSLDYTWLTDATIQFVTAPASGKRIIVTRNTPKQERLVNFQDGSILKESTLDEDSDQAFYLAQETLDAVENVREVETFIAGTHFTAGTSISLTLSGGDVLASSILVLFDGVIQQVTEYSVASGVITFASAIPVGVSQVQVSYAVPLTGGLSDGSVTTPKLGDLSVTTDKLVDGSVATGKLADSVIDGLTVVTPATNDYVPIADTSDSGKKKKTLISNILSLISLATTSILGLVRLATNAEAQLGSATDRALTPANLNSTVLGMNQSWQDVTASRVLATTYTNSTGRAILVNVSVTSTVAAAVRITLQGSFIIHGSSSSAGGNYLTTTCLVPPGHTYMVTVSSGTGTLQQWLELR